MTRIRFTAHITGRIMKYIYPAAKGKNSSENSLNGWVNNNENRFRLGIGDSI